MSLCALPEMSRSKIPCTGSCFMNTVIDPRWLRVLLCFVLAMLLLPLFAADVLAGPTASVLQANMLNELVGDRSRMLQFSVVFVGLGIAMLWWRR